uniref:Globin-sensor domain-containing protein n=1 Tax=Talaromyces marneffei PM1 TaxID=1077442 RepID=A0A093URS6_TALMA
MPGPDNSCPVEVPMVSETMISVNGTNETKEASCPMHSWPRAIQHIDRKDLYTNLEDRIHYLHSFLDFSSTLINGSKYIKALIPAVVNIVYRKLLQYDITARAFQTRSTSFEGPLDEFPSEDSPQIIHRKMFLRGYLVKLCSDPSKMEFWQYLDKVG